MRTHCIRGHELVGDNVYNWKGRGVECKKCRNAAFRRYEENHPGRKPLVNHPKRECLFCGEAFKPTRCDSYCCSTEHAIKVWRNRKRGKADNASGWPSPPTHCPYGHLFDEQNTRHGSSGRQCRACDRDRHQEMRDRAKKVLVFD